MIGRLAAIAAAVVAAVAAAAAALRLRSGKRGAESSAGSRSTAAMGGSARRRPTRRRSAKAQAAGTQAGGAGSAETGSAEGQSAETGASAAERAGPGLRDIKGLGSVSEGRLAAIGIDSVAQLAAWDEADVEEVAGKIEISAERIRREDWAGQARAMLAQEADAAR